MVAVPVTVTRFAAVVINLPPLSVKMPEILKAPPLTVTLFALAIVVFVIVLVAGISNPVVLAAVSARYKTE